jgi:hypothetical protein
MAGNRAELIGVTFLMVVDKAGRRDLTEFLLPPIFNG